MSKKQLIHIGQVFDAHGIRGDLVITVFSKDISWVHEATTLTLKKDGNLKLVNILKTRPHKKGFVCQLEAFDNRNLAEASIGSEVWVDEDLFTSVEGESLYLKEILGFEVSDQIQGSIGRIEAFSTNGLQDLLVIKHPETHKQVEIPFVKEFVVHVDQKNKTMMMKLPEGLLSINDSSSETAHED